jgi:NAD(P)-dependent dehydrogenase (short-subunit alcohol dehydrogenase family)
MKTAFITGGGTGIGEAIVRAAAADGYRVGIFERDADKAHALAREVPNTIALPGDVTDPASVDAALEKLGAVPDLLVNNAGIVIFTPLLDMEVEDFRRVTDINLNGAFIVTRAVARGMVARSSGSIVNVTSIAGVAASLGVNAYVSAKSGLARLTELMALEFGPSGVRANSVAPGFIDGGMSAAMYADPANRAKRSSGVPLRRLGTLQDIVDAVLFLGSDKASYITGQEIVVDGGVTRSVLAQLSRVSNG